MTENNICFTDNPSIEDRMERYISVDVLTDKVLESWRHSLFSHEWLLPDGRIRSPEELSAAEGARCKGIEKRLEKGEALEKPVLGIGLMDNVEIGIGRHIFLTAAAKGLKTIPVHIPKGQSDEFVDFLPSSLP